MARQVLPIAGAIIGGMIGGPVGAQVGMALGSLAGNAIDPQVINGPKLGEAGLQTSAEGVFRPIVLGTAAVKGNVIARGNRKVKTKRTRQSKGGGPVTEEQRVYWTFAIRIAGHEIKGVSRIWMDEKLVYDIRPGSTIPSESADFASRFRLYLGDEEQLPDPDLEAYLGIGNVPAYRGTPYIVFPNYDLTDYAERIPDFRFEVLGDGGVFAWDGTWTATEIPELSGTGNPKPAFSPSLGIAVYASVGGPYFTSNGSTWTHPDTFVAESICRSESHNLFVASRSSNSRVYTSATGDAPWTLRYDDAAVGGGQICYAEDLAEFYSLPSDNPPASACLFSASGTTGWTQHPLPSGGPKSVSRVIRSTLFGLYIAVCSNAVAAGSRLWTSPTGRDGDWTAIGTYNTDWTDVQEVEELGLVILTGRPDSVGAPMILTTADGSTFIDRTPSGYTSDPAGVTYIPDTGQVVIISSDGGNFLTSTNGTTYTPATGFPTGSGANAPVWCGAPINKIVAITTGGDLGDGVVLTNSTIVNGTTLGAIVSKMHQFAGHTAANYDVSELTDRVFGMVLAGDYTCGDTIRTLMPIYFFDASEHDSGTGYRIHYPKRGKPVVRTLTVDDLIEAPEKTTREDALERPRVLHLHYESPVVGYAPAKATERRDSPDVLVVGERSMQVPVGFDDQDEPRIIARKLMKVVYAEIPGEEEFTIHDGHLDLVQADCIGVALRGQVRRMRIAQQWVGQGDIRVNLIPDRQSAYTANVTGVPLPAVTPPLPSLPGQTINEILDIPALTDLGDVLLYYTAGTGQAAGWYGYQLQRKSAADVDFSDVLTVNQRTVMGELLTAIPAASEYYTDTTNVVQVQLYNDDVIDSLTDAQFLSEGGAFALEKDDGTWELLQYRDADEVGDGMFDLSFLARGRLNSGAAAHSVGARFVLLEGVRSVDAAAAHLGTTLTHRAVSLGTSSDGVATSAETFVGRSQIEFPCAHLFLERDSDTINCSTVPRHRFGSETNPVRSVNWAGYRWTATDGSNTATVDGTAATQSFDVTGWSSPVTVTVAQLNRYTGAGPTISEQIA